MILGAGDPDYGGTFDKFMQTALEMFAYAQALGEDRRDHPRDDLTSSLMHAELDGERLTPQEFGSFFILLVVAGNETTRNAISHGMKALTDFPDQRQIWWDDFDAVAPTAVEEIVRWATPVIHFRRTATADTEIRGVKIAEGDKVVYWYNSANRDEEKFANPGVFDVRRSPNPQTRLRRGRAALLPGRQPRPPRDHRDVRRAPPALARPARSPASRPACRARSSTASSACRVRGSNA